ncbi:hypothetical protein MNBD_ALPHA11-244 [hydrothermal vent metagenome]|uniref:Uncharacterized protein n=1 Tax=hydrothermal vent metagenome TaxID=652676 RepID=A0A3B0UI06_9ZZZZ
MQLQVFVPEADLVHILGAGGKRSKPAKITDNSKVVLKPRFLTAHEVARYIGNVSKTINGDKKNNGDK